MGLGCMEQADPGRAMRSGSGFPRRMRLRHKKDFERAYRQGNRARGDVLVVIAVDNGLEWSRVGLAIGKKVWKSAVRRNRVRRVFREAFRLESDRLPRGADFVLLAAAPRIEPELGATRAELVRLARRAHRRYRDKVARESTA